MGKELADLIVEHTYWCHGTYQPAKLPHLSLDKALEFQERMTQSLTHFAMWLDTVKLKRKCKCPIGMRHHALNCPHSPGEEQ